MNSKPGCKRGVHVVPGRPGERSHIDHGQRSLSDEAWSRSAGRKRGSLGSLKESPWPQRRGVAPAAGTCDTDSEPCEALANWPTRGVHQVLHAS
jgi:hypothetical protein